MDLVLNEMVLTFVFLFISDSLFFNIISKLRNMNHIDII